MSQPTNDSAVLLISCPDQKGIVASIAEFLYRNNANILHADQHQDATHQLFFMRVEWDLTAFEVPLDAFQTHFQPLAERFQMKWRLARSQYRPKVGILVSKFDHCLADLLYRHQSGELPCDIPLIISNHPDTKPWADFYNVPFVHIPISSDTKAMTEARQIELLREHDVDLVVLARYMQVLSDDFVATFPNAIINIHHSFLPAFVGAKPYHRAFERGVKIIGATSHYATAALDEGPIIEQDVARVSHRDNVENLIQKGRDLEKIVLSKAVRWHLENRILVYGNKTVIFD